jgi:NADH-quinone oxidoreductase subunit G
MPKLKIDGQEIDVPKGMKVIEAAERLGIIIPRFCYHQSLGSVGACRMCAVKFVDGPVKGIQMSCMIDSQDGMVVSTTDKETADFRRTVIEWLMMNHPHDCPVCDEGGHCLLQDMTVSGGHGIRRYPGKKRTYHDQDLGVFVYHEMNRCIHCWRCRRFYQDFAGYRDLGGMQIAYRTYFGRYKSGPLESPFSGNLNDLCPTGVYTDKPSRYTGRRWEFERAPSVCLHCSLGCNLVTSARYRQIVRHEARFNPLVNGYYICDRGRYGFYYTDSPERPRRARIGTEEVSVAEAINAASERICRVLNTGPDAVGCLGSARSSIETQAMLIRLCRTQGWSEPAFIETPEMARKMRRAVSRLDDRVTISMREIESVDFILVLGADPVNEAPMLALAMRQAVRKEATVAVIDPRPVVLPFEFESLPVAPAHLESCLSVLIKAVIESTAAEKLGKEAERFAKGFYDGAPSDSMPDPALMERIVRLAAKLKESRHPVIVCGMDVVPETEPDQAADLALLLHAAKGRAGLFYVMPGANAFGAALLASQDRSMMDLIEAVEHGAVKALILVETDPFWSFPDQERLRQALGRLDLLLAIDYVPSPSVRAAGIFLPSRTVFETEGSFVNQEGRIQFVSPVYRGGIPISQVGGGGHPPRIFRRDIPGGEPEPAWRLLAWLSKALDRDPKSGGQQPPVSSDDLRAWIKMEYPAFVGIEDTDRYPDGVRVNLPKGEPPAMPADRPNPVGGDDLCLLLVDWTFGTEELAAYSKPIQEAEKAPFVFIHPNDAARAGLLDGGMGTLDLDERALDIEVRVTGRMSPGHLVLPRHRTLPWQKVKNRPARVKMDQIRRKPS